VFVGVKDGTEERWRLEQIRKNKHINMSTEEGARRREQTGLVAEVGMES